MKENKEYFSQTKNTWKKTDYFQTLSLKRHAVRVGYVQISVIYAAGTRLKQQWSFSSSPAFCDSSEDKLDKQQALNVKK